MIKNLYCFFAHKSTVCVCVCVCVCTGDERSLNKWNQGKIIEISKYMESVVLGTPSYK